MTSSNQYKLKRATRVIIPNVHCQDALAQSGIATLSQKWEEASVNFIIREGSSHLFPHASVKRPYGVGLAEAYQFFVSLIL